MKSLNTNSPNINTVLGSLSIIIIIFFFLFISIYANIDLSDGRYAIFMDEQIIFDGVSKILHSSNIYELQKNIINGDHRYGRILYYISAYFSSIPENIFGEQGQIIGTRLVQTLTLITAYLIFSFTFFRQWKTRVLSLLLLLLMPTTLYYFTMPKPEPLQTLFLALFLWQANKYNFRFGWYWIFMGLAFGAKISASPYILMFGLLAMYQHNVETLSLKFWKYTMTKTIGLFTIGFLIAEPVLLTGRVQTYLNSTFRNTTHGADDKTITILSWLEFIFHTLSPIFVFLLVLGFGFIIIKIALKIVHIIRERSFKGMSLSSFHPIKKENIGFLILLFGILMLVLIMSRVDRLWYFYLHLPFLFIIIGTLMVLENFTLYKKGLVRFIAISLVIGSLFYSSIYVLIVSKKYTALASRTDGNNYKIKSSEYNYIKSFLHILSTKEDKRLNVYYDPRLYLLSSTPEYNIVRFWGWFLGWENKYDVIIFYPRHNGTEIDSKLSLTNINYSKYIKSKELYDKFVNEEKKYVQYISEDMPNGIRIFLKSDIAKKYKTIKKEND